MSFSKFDRWHERLIYNAKRSIFEQLFDKYSSVPKHIRNLRTLVIEICKVENGSYPVTMNGIFKLYGEVRYNKLDGIRKLRDEIPSTF